MYCLFDFLIVFNMFTLKFQLQNTFSKKIVLTMMKITVIKNAPFYIKAFILRYYFKNLKFLLLTQSNSFVF